MKVWVMFVEKPWKIWRNWEKSLGPSKVIIVPRSLDVVSINIIDLFFGTGNWTRTLINSKPAAKKQRNFSCVYNKPCLLNAALKRLVAQILFWSHFPNLSSLSLLRGRCYLAFVLRCGNQSFLSRHLVIAPSGNNRKLSFSLSCFNIGYSLEALVSFWVIEGNSLS